MSPLLRRFPKQQSAARVVARDERRERPRNRVQRAASPNFTYERLMPNVGYMNFHSMGAAGSGGGAGEGVCGD